MNTQPQNTAGAPKEDYLDKGKAVPMFFIPSVPVTYQPIAHKKPTDRLQKGLDAVEKKFGQGKINPEQSRSMNEKVTDGARGMFEKVTG